MRPHGVSDHYPWHELKDHDALRRYMDDAARLGLRVGIEYDLGVAPPLPRSTRDALDYVIGSVHRVTRGDRAFRMADAGNDFAVNFDGDSLAIEAETFQQFRKRQSFRNFLLFAV